MYASSGCPVRGSTQYQTAPARSSPLRSTVMPPSAARRVSKRAWLVGWALCSSFSAADSAPSRLAPLPPPRPAVAAPEPTTPAADSPEAAAEFPPLNAAQRCLAGLRASGAIAESVEQLSEQKSGCAIDAPVRLSVISAAGRAVTLPDRPIVACRFAATFAEWLIGSASVLAAGQGSPVKAVSTGPGHECRTRNRAPGGKLSSHAQGLAIDVASFSFANGAVLTVSAAASRPDAGFQSVRASACSVFSTVLGPGSDRFHADHLHLDLQPHGSGGSYRICQ